ncbi:protein LSM12 homolog B-like [Brassica napus]|uniref:protein LSM12 homolog B-like n=1 Tax=Brassica napus TaxID=3708 RepID=UPI002078AEB3|nr:protein LSM12 homolog B-like [Brassica napus]
MSPANATATKAGGGGSGDEYEVGKTYEVKLTTGNEFKGIVLAYDSDPHVVIFREGAIPGKCKSMMTTRTVNASFISKANLIGKCKDPMDSNKKKWFVDLSGLLEKEAIAIRRIESIGVGVTAEAQKIFDALSKTLHVKWENKDMVIMEDVRICSPYHSDSVTGGTRAANDRIKKVLNNVREKLQLSSDT